MTSTIPTQNNGTPVRYPNRREEARLDAAARAEQERAKLAVEREERRKDK
jgi:hypothetical protein